MRIQDLGEEDFIDQPQVAAWTIPYTLGTAGQGGGYRSASFPQKPKAKYPSQPREGGGLQIYTQRYVGGNGGRRGGFIFFWKGSNYVILSVFPK